MDPIQQFRAERQAYIQQIKNDKRLQKLGLRLSINSLRRKYSYTFDWLGRPIIQFPQDMVAMQGLIWEVKPDLIIETGIAHGGSLIFYASMLELIGRGEVVGIDIDIRKHNRREIEKHKLFKRITLIEGSSTDPEIIAKVKEVAKKHKTVLVALDSLHTHSHVLEELKAYAPLVSRGSYIVVFDTIVEYFPKGFFAHKPWSRGNNPKTAVDEFLKSHKNFEIQRDIGAKLLITAAPGGFLKRVR